MEQENILKFDNKELFNNEILHQYDEDGQKGVYAKLKKNQIIIENRSTQIV